MNYAFLGIAFFIIYNEMKSLTIISRVIFYIKNKKRKDCCQLAAEGEQHE